MRTIATILLGAVALFPLAAGGTIINIPDDYPTIQEGIDASYDGDTVLVASGTYFEAVIIDGKNICLTSLFLTTGDSSYIANTIIDGSESTRPISILGAVDTTMALIGFTIQNGYIGSGGGIGCFQSSPKISHNVIQNNRCNNYGGGIFCAQASPIIEYNTITSNIVEPGGANEGGGISCFGNSNPIIVSNIIESNTASRGGGIICTATSNAVISANTISYNHADSGAGIYCMASSPTIENNIIIGDSANAHGGGIYLNQSNPVIMGNTIKENFAWVYGGGIYGVGNSAIELRENIIYDNEVLFYGGAIYCDQCTLSIVNNTMYGNSANWGSGMALFFSSFIITNSIFAGNLDGAAIGIGSPAEQEISYCDFYGNLGGDFIGSIPPGIGELTSTNHNGDSCDVYFNIFLDPVFVGPYSEDFYLRWRSPCIDAGDPNSPLDPDNTICDMGRFYFNQDVMGVVELYPHDEPIVIPSGGGQLLYDGWVFNFIGHPGRADIWTYAFVPGIGRYGPIDLYPNFRIRPDSIGMNDIRKNVPGLAPQGDYTFVAYVGSYPSTIIDSSYFYFRKSGSAGGGITGWFEGTEWLKGGHLAESNLPSHYVVSQNYPNPFNATTVIEYALPVESHVKLQVYNVLGQKVATLVDSKQQAGYRSISWDASKVSSGIYFYKLAAGSKVFSNRMMLLK